MQLKTLTSTKNAFPFIQETTKILTNGVSLRRMTFYQRIRLQLGRTLSSNEEHRKRAATVQSSPEPTQTVLPNFPQERIPNKSHRLASSNITSPGRKKTRLLLRCEERQGTMTISSTSITHTHTPYTTKHIMVPFSTTTTDNKKLRGLGTGCGCGNRRVFNFKVFGAQLDHDRFFPPQCTSLRLHVYVRKR